MNKVLQRKVQGEEGGYPHKRFYRARAHSNPLNDAHFPVPTSPADVDWVRLYPVLAQQPAALDTSTAQPAAAAAVADGGAGAAAPRASNEDGTAGATAAADASAVAAAPVVDRLVRFVDVGCGFGGLLIRLAPLYPDKLMLGFELRDKVSEFVKERILALRREQPGSFQNIACARTNAMRYLPNYFCKGQLQKLFFLFPDPHFKATNHRRRIIQTSLLAEYAYLLAVGGMLYTISDVQDLADWMQAKLDVHPLFERVSDEELEEDPAAGLLAEGTEEGQKVVRNSGQVWRAVYRRIAGAAETG